MAGSCAARKGKEATKTAIPKRAGSGALSQLKGAPEVLQWGCG